MKFSDDGAGATNDSRGAESSSGQSEVANSNLFSYFTGSLSELISQAKQLTQGLIKKVVAPISSRLKADLSAKGIEIDDTYKHVIDNNAIRHTLKQHGGKSELKRGQIPVTDEDFNRISDVVENYDNINIEEGKRGDINIVYSKTYADGITIFVEEKRDNRKELAAVTMWKKKNPNLTDANSNETTPISDLSEAFSENKDKAGKVQKQENEQNSTETIFEQAARIAKNLEIESERKKVNQNPSEAQIEAGNYKKGHVDIQGFNVTIENPKGSTRSGVDESGKEWSINMQNDYGYIRGTKSTDHEQIDVFVGPNPNSKKVFVVDQINKDGSFDEHKVMFGFDSVEEAREAYLSNYEDGWQGLGNVTETDIDSFRKWAEMDGRRIKPFAEYKSVNNQTEEWNESVQDEVSALGTELTKAHKAGQDTKEIENRLSEALKKASDKQLEDTFDGLSKSSQPKHPVRDTAIRLVKKEIDRRNAVINHHAEYKSNLKSEENIPVMTEEEYLSANGAPFMDGAEPALHKNIKDDKNKQKNIKRVSEEMRKNNDRREELRKEYAEKVANGEIRQPSRTEQLVATAKGHEDNEATQAARRLLAKRGVDWESGNNGTRFQIEDTNTTAVEREMENIKQKALTYLSAPEIITGATNKSELHSATKVVNRFENPKLQQGSLRFKSVVKKKLTKLVNKLKKVGLAKDVIVDKAEFDRVLTENKGMEMSDKKGTIYGFVTHDGTIYLNPDKMNANTPIHEFGHLWLDFIKETNPELYRKGLELVEGTSYFDEVNQSEVYKNDSHEQRAGEALAWAIGDKGEAVRNSGVLSYARIKAYLYDMWNWIAEKIGIKKSKGQISIEDMTLEDFTSLATNQLLGGKNIVENNAYTINYIKSQLKQVDSSLIDVLEIQQDEDILNNYKSFSDEGLLEAEAKYENSENNTNFANNETSSTNTGEARMDNGSTMESSSISETLADAERRDKISKTISASNLAGNTSDVFDAEEREELEARGLNPDWDSTKFRKGLRSQAQTNGVWLEKDYLNDKTLIHDQKKSGTSENDVYRNSDGKTLTKLNNLSYVKSGDKAISLNAFIDRLNVHNALFPNSAYTIKGFMENKNGFPSMVLEQDLIPSERNATQKEIDDYLKEMGFQKNGIREWSNGHEVWSNGVYELFDARPANVLMGKDGNLYFIDTIPHSVEYTGQTHLKFNIF